MKEELTMSDLRSRVAYLQGLAEGLDIDASSAEGRVLGAVVDVMGDLAEAIDQLADTQEEMADYLEEMDDDLSTVEESVLEEGLDGVIPTEHVHVHHEDGVAMACCPDCGETLGAGAGEMADLDFDVNCPVCGASLRADD